MKAIVFAAVPQNQTQVQRRNRPRLARARTGFDQTTAPERKSQSVQRLTHAAPPTLTDAAGASSLRAPSITGSCITTVTWFAAHA